MSKVPLTVPGLAVGKWAEGDRALRFRFLFYLLYHLKFV